MMTNSQKINIKIEELQKKAAALISVEYESDIHRKLQKEEHNTIQDQIAGLEMAREIIERG